MNLIGKTYKVLALDILMTKMERDTANKGTFDAARLLQAYAGIDSPRVA